MNTFKTVIFVIAVLVINGHIQKFYKAFKDLVRAVKEALEDKKLTSGEIKLIFKEALDIKDIILQILRAIRV